MTLLRNANRILPAVRSASTGLLCVVMMAGAVTGAHAALSPGLHQNLPLVHDGEARLYDVLVPTMYDGSIAVPLLVDIHGFNGSRAGQRSVSGFAGIAEAEGFVVAWPQGLFTDGDINTNTGGPSWNAGDWCCGEAAVQQTDDVGFIRSMVAAVIAEANIDVGRIYVTGHSNGGALTHRLACDAADLFAAGASFAFPSSLVSPCALSRPMPMLMVASRTDQIIPYDGGHVVFGNPALPVVPSAADGFADWRMQNGCTGSTPDVTENPGASSECEFYTACSEGAEVGLCSVDADAGGSGHVPYSVGIADGFNSEQRAWEFLSQFETPAVPIPMFPERAHVILGALLSLAMLLVLRRRQARERAG